MPGKANRFVQIAGFVALLCPFRALAGLERHGIAYPTRECCPNRPCSWLSRRDVAPYKTICRASTLDLLWSQGPKRARPMGHHLHLRIYRPYLVGSKPEKSTGCCSSLPWNVVNYRSCDESATHCGSTFALLYPDLTLKSSLSRVWLSYRFLSSLQLSKPSPSRARHTVTSRFSSS